MAFGAGGGGVLSMVAAQMGLLGDVEPLDFRSELVFVAVFVGYLVVPAVAYALLVLMIIKGPAWMAARPLLAIATILTGIAACIVVGWLAVGMPPVLFAVFTLPIAVGAWNLMQLSAAMWRRRAAPPATSSA